MSSDTGPARRQALLLWWIALCVFALAVHWLDFRAWFRADDFAWLGLTPGVHNLHDLLTALFEPRAQGTIRPWSERAFFIAGYTLFGLNALPYRILIFATGFADLALIAWIGRRLTGSTAAGVSAGALWIVNSGSMEPLGWACVYNEVQCALFLLLAFYFLLRAIDSGQRRFEVCEWAVFLLGFGALELNVVYPALAAGYTLFRARAHFRRTLPLFAVSAVYALAHHLAAPAPHTGAYAMHFDLSIFRTLMTLWSWTVGPTYLSTPFAIPAWLIVALVVLLSLALVAFTVKEWRAGIAPFFLLWFLVTVAPLLPLRDHVTEYYVFIPAIGVAWLGGWGVVRAWRSGIAPRAGAVALVAVYGILQLPQLAVASNWNYQLTLRTENLVESVAGAHQLHPQQAILLYGVDSDLFWNAVRDHPFHLIGIDQVYLAPGTGAHLENRPEWEGAGEFVLAGTVVSRQLAREQLVVYDVRGPKLRNMTPLYANLPRENSLPRRVDVGDTLISDLLGPEWYRLEVNHRWMPHRATLRMAGPEFASQKLYLRGNCTAEQLRQGALTVTVSIDGLALPPATIHPGETSFELAIPLPASAVGKPEIAVAIAVDRVFHPPADERELGLAFGPIEIR